MILGADWGAKGYVMNLCLLGVLWFDFIIILSYQITLSTDDKLITSLSYFKINYHPNTWFNSTSALVLFEIYIDEDGVWCASRIDVLLKVLMIYIVYFVLKLLCCAFNFISRMISMCFQFHFYLALDCIAFHNSWVCF